MVLVNINIETDYFLTSTFMQFDLQTAFGSVAQKKGVCSSDPLSTAPSSCSSFVYCPSL